MGTQFWWIFDVAVAAAVIICIFLMGKKGIIRSSISLVGFIISLALAVTISGTVSESIYKNTVRDSNVTKLNKTLNDVPFTENLKNYLNGLGYNLTVRSENLDKVFTSGKDIDQGIYNYMYHINNKKFDEEGQFFNLLHEGYAYVMSDIISRNLNAYSAEEAAEQIKNDPAKFEELIKLMVSKDPDEVMDMKPAAEFIADNYIADTYLSMIRLICLISILFILVIITLLIAKASSRNEEPASTLITHTIGGVSGALIGAAIVFAIAVIVRLNVILGNNDMLLFNSSSIEKTYIFKYIYNIVLSL